MFSRRGTARHHTTRAVIGIDCGPLGVFTSRSTTVPGRASAFVCTKSPFSEKFRTMPLCRRPSISSRQGMRFLVRTSWCARIDHPPQALAAISAEPTIVLRWPITRITELWRTAVRILHSRSGTP